MTETSQDNGSSSLLDALPTDRLLEAGRTLLSAATSRAVDMALDRIDDLTARRASGAQHRGEVVEGALRRVAPGR